MIANHCGDPYYGYVTPKKTTKNKIIRIIIASMLGSLATTLVAGDVSVRLMSYNIKGFGVGFGNGNDHIPNWKKTDKNVKALIDQLKRYTPEIVAFQEVPVACATAVDPATNKTLLQQIIDDALPGYHIAIGSDTQAHKERSAIVSKWPIQFSNSWLVLKDLSPWDVVVSPREALNPKAYFWKDLFEARIGKLHVFSAHLKAHHDTDRQGMWRVAEALAIRDHFVNYHRPTFPNNPYVLVGDMNEDVDHPKPPTAKGQVIWGAIQQLVAPDTGLYLTTPVRFTDDGRPTTETDTHSTRSASPKTRYDYVLPSASIRGSMTQAKIGGRFEDAVQVSDHYPVMITFTINEDDLKVQGASPQSPSAINNAGAVSIEAPDTVFEGEPFQAAVTMNNPAGCKQWDFGGTNSYALGSQDPRDSFTWGLARVYPVSGPVPAGTNCRFNFTAKAPAAGQYDFSWQMLQENVAWFGAKATKKINVIQRANNAQLVALYVPSKVVVGENFTVIVRMKNTGSNVWTDGSLYHLGLVGDGDTWGENRVQLPRSVAPGEIVEFAFNRKAPSTAGRRDFFWRMVQDSVEWFGDTLQEKIEVVHPANLHSIELMSVPLTVTAGDNFDVYYKIKNLGTKTWTSDETPHRFGSTGDDMTWGVGRVGLPNGTPVAPGESVEFRFKASAPAKPGAYNFNWDMVEDSVEWFGRPYNQVVTVKAPFNSSTLGTVQVPTVVATGQKFTATFCMLNNGTKVWNSDSTPNKLVNINEPKVWGLAQVDLPRDTPPGSWAVFSADATAPITPGKYSFDWQMVEHGVEYFGPTSRHTIEVKEPWNDAVVRPYSVPTEVVAGRTFSAKILAKNTGTKIWTYDGTPHRLGSQTPQDNSTWGIGRVELPSAVGPQTEMCFDIVAKAPLKSGTYQFDWQMVEDGVTWFGNKATSTIRVLPVPENDAELVELLTSIPKTLIANQTFTAWIRLKNIGSTTWSSSHKLVNLVNQWGFTQVVMPKDVLPGQEVSIIVNGTAPATLGELDFTIQLSNGAAPFGPRVSRKIQVAPQNAYDAEFLGWGGSGIYPALAGQSITGLWHIKNTGTRTWTKDEQLVYIKSNGEQTSPWGFQSVALPRDVAPGEAIYLVAHGTAPTNSGSYNWKWQMQGSVGLFGSMNNQTIKVQQ